MLFAGRSHLFGEAVMGPRNAVLYARHCCGQAVVINDMALTLHRLPFMHTLVHEVLYNP